MKTQNKFLISVLGLAALAALPACEKTDRTFSLLDSGSTFQQAASYETRKIDVLWVIDNSGSMASSQANLTANFSSFINQFQSKGYDFHMAVTGSDAWRGDITGLNVNNANLLRRARPGRINFTSPYTYATNSLINIIDPTTSDMTNVFVTNASQGTTGTGDERPFQSIKAFLNYDGNSDFRRADAFLAVIIVSDEDDFSITKADGSPDNYPFYGDFDEEAPNNLVTEHPMELVAPTPANAQDIYYLYNSSRLNTVQSYKDYLDSKLTSTDNYSVNTIAVLDTDCRKTLNDQVGGRRLGRRYAQMADLTNGVKASLCGDFAASLELIAKQTLKLTAKFKLNREPDQSTIKVVVDGVTIPNDANSGWSYNAADWSITFNGNSVPPQGSNVQIFFTPLRADN